MDLEVPGVYGNSLHRVRDTGCGCDCAHIHAGGAGSPGRVLQVVGWGNETTVRM